MIITSLLLLLLMMMIQLTLGIEHARLVERLKSEKDAELNSRLEQLEKQTATRIELLQQQHSDTINSLNAGNLPSISSSSSSSRHRHRVIIITGIIIIVSADASLN